MSEKGTISVQSGNIFPVIKKFLYSDCDVFLRELVSNAVDACNKLKQLSSMGKYDGDVSNQQVIISLDKDKKTLTISDNGIGMTDEEVKKYINQLAFSGATDFVNKYKDQGDPKQLIGFFGLGFYSAFMVSERVDIITKSYNGDEAVFWTCDGSTEFEIDKASKDTVGTDVVLHINQPEYLDEDKIQALLNKFCKFLPVPVLYKGAVVNNITPIWVKHPQDLKDEDYKNFYKELYPYSEEPLFWIHLNIDYPFNLTGILYFPNNLQAFDNRNKIHLYARQVFITDEVNEIVPSFLLLLYGIIDSPDIPLNVSRSALQSDRNVKMISTYITKKVAEKLLEIYKNDKPTFEKNWSKMETLIKYGILSNDKFYEIAKDFMLLKSTDGTYSNVAEYIEIVKDRQTDKDARVVLLYSTNVDTQDMFIQNCKAKGYDVLILNNNLDNHLITFLESKYDNRINFKSVDSATVDELIPSIIEKPNSIELSQTDQDTLKGIFDETIGDKNIKWEVKSLSKDDLPVVITVSESMQRLQAMEQWQYGNTSMYNIPLESHAIINSAYPGIISLLDTPSKDKQKENAKLFYQIGLLSQGKLKGSSLTEFIHTLISTK